MFKLRRKAQSRREILRLLRTKNSIDRGKAPADALREVQEHGGSLRRKKTAAQVQSESLPAPQAQPKSVAEVFAEAKANAQTQKPVPKTMVEILAELKANAQGQVAPKHSSPPQQSNYNPLNEYTSPYQEDVTIKEKFFSTEGRLNRKRYFNRTLIVNIAILVLVGVISSAFSMPSGDITPTGNNLMNLVIAAMLVPKYCLDVRRLKDIGETFPGYQVKNIPIQMLAVMIVVFSLIHLYSLRNWELGNKIPEHASFFSIVLLVWWLWVQCKAGTVGPNKYGADPLENERRFNQ